MPDVMPKIVQAGYPLVMGTGEDPGPTLMELSAEVRQHMGRIEDMSQERRLWLLGAFAGAADRCAEDFRQLGLSAGDLARVLGVLGEKAGT